MPLAPHAPAPVTPHSLQGRVARAMYEASTDTVGGAPSFLAIGHVEREKFEKMAAAAITVCLREPVTA